jgi:hypothetical protein
MLIAINMLEFDYTCGAAIADPKKSLLKHVSIRSNLTCAVAVEVTYYGNGSGQPDICTYCAQVNPELKKSYKTVLPICEPCENSGLSAIIHRPYGGKKKKEICYNLI